MYKWGEKKLKIEPGSYSPPYAPRQREIIDLIPGADLTRPNSVMQDGGRERYRVAMNGFCNTYAEYLELYADYMASVSRVFIGPDGETLTAIIFELSEPSREMYKKFSYSITLMEV